MTEQVQLTEELLSALINPPGDIMVFAVDGHYCYTAFNENHRKVMKSLWNAEIRTGMNLLDCLHEAGTKERMKTSIDRTLAGESFTEIVQHGDSGPYLQMDWTPVAWSNGISGAAVHCKDLTEHNNSFWAGFFLNSMQGIAIGLPQSDRLLTCNEAFALMLGRSVEEVSSMPVSELFAPGDRDQVQQAIAIADQKGKSSFEAYMIKKDGMVYPVQTEIVTVRDQKGNSLYRIITQADLTTRKKSEEALIMAKEQAETNDRLKSAFIRSISDEVRAPLNSILGFSLMIIAPGISNEDKALYSSYIKKSSTRLLKTITNYMDISMIVSGSYAVHRKEFPLDSLLSDLKNEFDPAARVKQLELYVKRPPESKSLSIETDRDLLFKVLSHLIDNAIKFTRKGTIEFGLRIVDDKPGFFVSDTGIGISREQMQVIFDHFTQGEPSPQRGYEGSGLGLSIAGGLVRLLGGEIRVDSEVNRGSVFSFTVPGILQKPETSKAKTPVLRKGKTAGNVILVAEDDEINYMFVEIVLKRAGYQVLWAENGLKAVELCEENNGISLVLMDIKMPVMGGIEATYRIREMYPDMPVIALTAYVSHDEELEAYFKHCTGFLPKPIDKNKLLEAVTAAMKS